MRINGIGSVELLETADPAAADAVRQRGRRPVVVRTAGQPSVINGIEAVILGDSTSGPGSLIRLDSADPTASREARQRGQRPLVVVDSTGAVQASSVATSYANPGGTGNRTAIITATHTGSWAGNVQLLVNGTSLSDAYFSVISVGNYMRFDFGVGAKKVIDEITWKQSGAQAQGNWTWQYSDDASAWTTLTTGITLGLGAATTTHTVAQHAAGHRYYQLVLASGSTSSGPYLYEIEFKIGAVP